MPKLLERAGMSDKGSITGLYTVLVDGDDFNEPITDTARSILDGHIVLSRKLGQKNHYPAIDVLQSISRCMSQIVDKKHKQMAGRMKNVMATYNEAEDLISIRAALTVILIMLYIRLMQLISSLCSRRMKSLILKMKSHNCQIYLRIMKHLKMAHFS
jgi:F0F1-type ATP synthase alpha subunit